MGAGDVKLLAMVGAFLGPLATFYAALATMIVGGARLSAFRAWRAAPRRACSATLRRSFRTVTYGAFAGAPQANARVTCQNRPANLPYRRADRDRHDWLPGISSIRFDLEKRVAVMKNTRAMVMLGISILLGMLVTALAVAWVSHKGAIASNKIVVATMDIELGSRLNGQMLKTVDWPSGSVPPGGFDDVKNLQDRVVRTSIQRGEAILTSKLAPVGTQGGLSAVIAEGKRAMTVRVNDVVGVAGFALPGNYVDVMVSTQQERPGVKNGDEKQQISKTVLTHVLVLAVAQEAGRDDTKPKVVNAVTLELTLEDAEKLDLARNIGTLSLVLRNQIDNGNNPTLGVRKSDVLGLTEPARVPVTVKPGSRPAVARVVEPVPVVEKAKVEVIRGVQKSRAELDL
jgi:pilus assembly protein CpaB